MFSYAMICNYDELMMFSAFYLSAMQPALFNTTHLGKKYQAPKIAVVTSKHNMTVGKGSFTTILRTNALAKLLSVRSLPCVFRDQLVRVLLQPIPLCKT